MSSRIVVVFLFALFTASTTREVAGVTADALREPSLHAWLVAGYWALRLAVVAAFTFFLAVREPSRRPAREPVAFVACAGAIVSVIAMAPPTEQAPTALLLAGEGLALVSVAWLLVSVLALGRCFGVLPEARGLVTRGPYRLVRHPVYVGEIAACAGLLVGAFSAWNAGCFVLLCAAQRVRMGLEERALQDAFPEYAAYAARTPRLIPWTAPTPSAAYPTPPAQPASTSH
jgi:protein-S-isoprenylcysteine O-methyltransferase Ste14